MIDKSLWDLYTRKEEYNPVSLDRYSRFPYYLSNNRNIFVPEVSKFLVENGWNIEYPHGSEFCVCLTHDIDYIHMSNIGRMLKILRKAPQLRIKDSFKNVAHILSIKKNPYWNFEKILTIEEKYNARSSFFILTLNRPDEDFSFCVNELEEVINNIISSGSEICLHGGHKAFVDLHEIIEKKKILESVIGKEVIGFRNHYLKFKVPDTWIHLSKAGIKYDSTCGYADCVGFRNGMCHPYNPFNLNSNQFINILEIPLVIMDSTLFGYMALDYSNAWKITKRLIDEAKRYNGVITVLWHNTALSGDNSELYSKLYEKILRYSYESNAWMTSGEEIYNWWTSKGLKLSFPDHPF